VAKARAQDAKDLAEFARGGSAGAFARLSGRYAGLVYRTCLRRLGSAADAEDAAQSVFVALSRKAGRVRPDRLAAWLHSAAMRASLFIARSRANRARYEGEAARMKSAENGRREPPDREALEHLDAEIERLPAKLREAVARHYLAGLSRSELAGELGVPEGTVQSRLNAGLEKLRARLGGRGVRLGAAALAGLLSSEAAAGAPASLLASLPTLVSGSAAGGAAAAAGAGAGISLIAEGVLKAMLWTKIKIAAAVLAAATVVAGVGTPLAVNAAGGDDETARAPVASARKDVIRARVVAVRPSPVDGPSAVTIDKGSAGGVKAGFVFRITRDGKEINEFTVKTLTEGEATGLVKFASAWVPARIVKVGDVAETRFQDVVPEGPRGPAAPAAPAPPAVEREVHAKVLYGAAALGRGAVSAEDWIKAEAARMGSPAVGPDTGWIRLSGDVRQIYASMRGGRLIQGSATAKAGQVVTRFTGRRTSGLPVTVRLPDRPGARRVVKVTDYPGAGNVFLAVRVVEGRTGVVNGLRLRLIPSYRITLRKGAECISRPGTRFEKAEKSEKESTFTCDILDDRGETLLVEVYAGQRERSVIRRADVLSQDAVFDYVKLRWENADRKGIILPKGKCLYCDPEGGVKFFLVGPGGKQAPRHACRPGCHHRAKDVPLPVGQALEVYAGVWCCVDKPAAPGTYTLWAELERKASPPAAKAGYWNGKVRSNAVRVRIGAPPAGPVNGLQLRLEQVASRTVGSGVGAVLDKRVSAQFVDAPLKEVLIFLSQVAGVPFRLEAGAPDKALSFKITGKPLSEYIDAILAACPDIEVRFVGKPRFRRETVVFRKKGGAYLDYRLRWVNVGKKPLVLYRDRCCDLYGRVMVKGPDGKIVPARTDNRMRKQHPGALIVRIEPGGADDGMLDPWFYAVEPAAPGEYTMWVEFEVKGVRARSKTPRELIGAREWTGKVRSNAVRFMIGPLVGRRPAKPARPATPKPADPEEVF
jgi:RNA polymerase sigma factor (sigma-70 family)